MTVERRAVPLFGQTIATFPFQLQTLYLSSPAAAHR
jgi:hypothetical protein